MQARHRRRNVIQVAAERRSARLRILGALRNGEATTNYWVREDERGVPVPPTRHLKATVHARIARDPKYRKEFLREGVECLLAGDLDTGKAILREYINATIGFEQLSDLTRMPTKSLMRMFGPKGSPQARNLFEAIAQLQRTEGLHFELSLEA